MNHPSPLHLFAPQEHLFRGYDIRGDCRYFSNDFIYALSTILIADFQNYPEQQLSHGSCIQPPRKIVIGFDVRHGSETIAKQIAYYFSSAGFDVVWLGLVTTPMLLYWAEQHQSESDKNGIIVTASHSAKENTGIKWLQHGQSPTPATVATVYQRLNMGSINGYDSRVVDVLDYDKIITPQNMVQVWHQCQPTLTHIVSPVDAYLQSIDKALRAVARKPTIDTSPTNDHYFIDTLAVDCLNGATAGFVQRIFSRYAKNIHIINDTADANFSKGCPNPTAQGRLVELQQLVKNVHADIGLAFDGDGDRIVVIDNNGKVLQSDNLLYLLARSVNVNAQVAHNYNGKLANICKKNKVLFDVKCSHHLPTMLQAINLQPLIAETGSNLMRQKMIDDDSDIIFAGELSGHFIFNDGCFIVHDDAIYAGLRLIQWLAQQNDSLANIHNNLPKMVSTADTYIKAVERENILATFIAAIQKIIVLNIEKDKKKKDTQNTPKITTIDGLRIDTNEGFGLIRLSNTSQSLTIRFSGNTLKDVKKIQQKFVDICLSFDAVLAKQIQNITAHSN